MLCLKQHNRLTISHNNFSLEFTSLSLNSLYKKTFVFKFNLNIQKLIQEYHFIYNLCKKKITIIIKKMGSCFILLSTVF